MKPRTHLFSIMKHSGTHTHTLSYANTHTHTHIIAQVKVFEANCIFAGVCAPQVFVYSPGMYSSSNKDFVRGTVTSFYEMFKQLSVRGGLSSNNGEEEDEEQRDFRAFAFGNNTLDEEKVCPTDDLEWQLKVRNQAMKRGCASEQMDGLKRSLFAVRVVVDTIVRTMFLILDIVVCLFLLLIPSNGESEFAQIMAELDFLFNELINTTSSRPRSSWPTCFSTSSSCQAIWALP